MKHFKNPSQGWWYVLGSLLIGLFSLAACEEDNEPDFDPAGFTCQPVAWRVDSSRLGPLDTIQQTKDVIVYITSQFKAISQPDSAFSFEAAASALGLTPLDENMEAAWQVTSIIPQSGSSFEGIFSGWQASNSGKLQVYRSAKFKIYYIETTQFFSRSLVVVEPGSEKIPIAVFDADSADRVRAQCVFGIASSRIYVDENFTYERTGLDRKRLSFEIPPKTDRRYYKAFPEIAFDAATEVLLEYYYDTAPYLDVNEDGTPRPADALKEVDVELVFSFAVR